MSPSVALRRTRDLALLGGLLFAGGLVVAGFTVPLYAAETTEVTPGGGSRTTSTTSTLIEENGQDALIPLLIPVTAVLVVAYALLVLPGLLGRGVAWTTTFLLAAFAALAALSIGMFVVPVVAALLVACVVDVARSHNRGAAVTAGVGDQ